MLTVSAECSRRSETGVGLHACASGKSVLYMSITALQENLAIARSSASP